MGQLVSLATTSLLRIGVAEPARHMALIARHACATLILLIGLGFMWVRIPFMQRFSVYLGHPVFAVVVI